MEKSSESVGPVEEAGIRFPFSHRNDVLDICRTNSVEGSNIKRW